ncbi:MAG TPA: SCO family protein [Candidatus Sulfotelmatobacter sp.]|jgi:protein SCO1/2|nr:SCO family protein [Candidatus Sulfotelmatobacter sp.]
MKHILMTLVLICAGFAGGCQSAPEKHYPILGEVISAEPAKKLITVKHGDIPGLMPAMTMTYQVAEPKQIETLQPGDKITADLVVSDSKGRLEKIVLVGKGDGKSSPGTTQRIPEKGDAVPDFALVNQDGKIIHFGNYRGKVLLVTFIYTRCPLPDFCPRMNENFRAVQKLLQEVPGATERVEFLSISFDPEHDTPAVLKHYASLYKKNAPGEKSFDWQFAVPSAKDLPELAQFFGLVYRPEQTQIVHSLSTTVIGPDGKVEKWYSDNEWTPADAAQAISSLLHQV